MRMIYTLILLLVLGGMAWFRVAPSDPSKWHIDPMATADQDLVKGVRRRVPADQMTLVELDRIITRTARTSVLAGSAEAGHVTYVTRSKWLGFPDYISVKQKGAHLEIFGRLRFGHSDMGVNRKRVDHWLQDLRSVASKS